MPDIPKPKPWDFAAIATLVVALLVTGANWSMASSTPPGTSLSGKTTFIIVLIQMAVMSAALLVLGKTAKEGTIWGNLMAVAGMAAGSGGVLLAAALRTMA